MTENHDIPEHLIPAGEHVVAGEEETDRIEHENELGEKLGTGKHVYTEEPDDNRCPYCGKKYDSVTFASRVQSGGKGVCPYPVEEHGDFIVSFQHGEQRTPTGAVQYQAECSIEYEDNLLTTMEKGAKDWDVTNI